MPPLGDVINLGLPRRVIALWHPNEWVAIVPVCGDRVIFLDHASRPEALVEITKEVPRARIAHTGPWK